MDDPIRVLLIEDNPADALLVQRALREADGGRFEFERVGLLGDGLRRLGESPFDVVLLDLGLPDSRGMETLGRVIDGAPTVATIVLTGTNDDELAATAAQRGAQDYFVKGLMDADSVARGLRYAIERKRAQEALRRSEERARVLLESVSEAILVLDSGGVITWMSPSTERVMARTCAALLGSRLLDHVHPDDFAVAKTLLLADGDGTRPVDIRLDDDAGGWRVLEALGRNLLEDARIEGVLITLRDMTDKRRLERALAQSQRIETVGRFAGGIAHDFNNLLTAVLGYSQLISRDLPSDSHLREFVEGIERAGDRAAALTRQLLIFSRGQVVSPGLVNLNDLISNMLGLLRTSIPESIRIVRTTIPGLGIVRAEAGQLEQVILNLALNARDAMPGGGTLTIETANLAWDEDEVVARPGSLPGEYVVVAVTDTGTGMPEEVRARIFEPFFTTKEVGKGTGLGLSVCHGIVKQAGGHIEVYSDLGRGTCMKVYLPRAQEADPSDRRPLPRDMVVGGTETVLVVEDEAVLRDIVVRSLTDLGYSVIGATCPADAIQFASHGDRAIDLLLSDVVMPGMLGTELAEAIHEMLPGTRVLLMSGYTASALGFTAGGRVPWDDVLTKPFTPNMLARKVRTILDRDKV